ncbi:hypothetical protein SESBI_11729 [Sesbania bispinosa]|nr:hypothetical protein SESBI_11729 [Sesbania bispinosa]
MKPYRRGDELTASATLWTVTMRQDRKRKAATGARTEVRRRVFTPQTTSSAVLRKENPLRRRNSVLSLHPSPLRRISVRAPVAALRSRSRRIVTVHNVALAVSSSPRR